MEQKDMGFFRAPKVQSAAPQELEEKEKKSRMARKALFATQGGARGEELLAPQNQNKDTTFGN